MDKIQFGKIIAYFRKNAGMTQDELAYKINCAPSTISRIENGKEIPKVEMFEKLNDIFASMNIHYDEIAMEEIFEFDRAKDELLEAINSGRAEELERKIDIFKKLMDENNTEHQQYYIMAYLIYMRKNGMSVEEFLDRSIALFELGRKIPQMDDLANANLTKIEHTIIYQMGIAHQKIGNDAEAEKILQGLMKQGFASTADFYKNRCESLSASLATLFVNKADYEKAEECVNYLLQKFIDSFDTRMLFQSLSLQLRLFEAEGNSEGAYCIDEFLESSQRMINYMYKYKREKQG